MRFKTVQSSFAKPWAPTTGEHVIGTYKGSEQIPAPRKPGTFFTSYRIGNLDREVLAEDGQKVSTFGISGAMLNSKFNQIPVGAKVKITYAGTAKVGKGMAKMFDVEVDDSVELLDPDLSGSGSASAHGDDDTSDLPF